MDIYNVMVLAFWHVATALTALIIPLIVIWVVFNIIVTVLFGRKT